MISRIVLKIFKAKNIGSKLFIKQILTMFEALKRQS